MQWILYPIGRPSMLARYLGLIILTVCLCQSIVHASNDDRILKQVANQVGPIVPSQEIPFLSRKLNEIFNDLSKAQETLVGDKTVSLNKVYVVRSQQLNAFVSTDKEKGVDIMRSYVFITTALIDFMRSGADKEKGWLRIAGVFSHELGHPIDGVDNLYSIDNHYGKNASQAIEIRADIDGMLILKEAKYPTESLMLALERLAEEKNTGSSVILAGASTHPEKDFRLSNARLFLTYDRLENSTARAPVPKIIEDADDLSIEKELQPLRVKQVKSPYSSPKTLAEAVQRLRMLSKAMDVDLSYKQLETNRIVLSVDGFLANKEKQNIELTTEEQKDFTDFLTSISGALLFQGVGLHNNINAETSGDISEINTGNSHTTYLSRLKIYSSPLVKDFLLRRKAEVSERMNNTLPALGMLSGFVNLASPALLSETFGPDLAIEYEKKEQDLQFEVFAKGKSLQFYQMLLGIQKKAFAKNLDPAERLRRMLNPTDGDILFPIIATSVKDAQVKKNIDTLFHQAVRLAKYSKNPQVQKQMQSVVDDFKEHFQHFWDRKAFYAVLETQFESSVVDWELIFSILDIRPDLGRQAIEKDVVLYKQGRKQFADLPTFSETVQQFAELESVARGKGGKKWFAWDSKQVLAGSISNDPKNLAQEMYDVKNKETFFKTFAKNVNDKINSVKTTDDFVQMHLVNAPSIRHTHEVTSYDTFFYFRTHLTAIKESKLPAEVKKALMHFILFGDAIHVPKTTQFLPRFFGVSDNSVPFLESQEALTFGLDILQKETGEDSVDYFTELRDHVEDLKLSDAGYFLAIDIAGSSILKDLKNKSFKGTADIYKATNFINPIERKELRYKDSVNNVAAPMYDTSETKSTSAQKNSAQIQKIKGLLIQKFLQFHPTVADKYKLFLLLTATGPSKDTDQLFLNIMGMTEGELSSADVKKQSDLLSDKERNRLEMLLKDRRIRSEKIRLTLTTIVLEKTLTSLRMKLPVDRFSLYDLILNKINQYAPQGSMDKDRYIESIAWRLKLRGLELKAFTENQKSHNWRKASPFIVNMGGMMSAQIASMSIEKKMDMILYLIDPVNNETKFFASIMDDLRASAKETLRTATKKNSYEPELTEEALRAKADRAAEQTRLQLEEAIRDSSPFERLPLYEVLLTSGGDKAILKMPNWHLVIARKFLKYQENSVEEALLSSFLEVIPAHEKPATLAYLLTQANEGEGNMAKLFEVFGTVGIKFGQLASVWEIFGKQLAKQTKHLKSSAAALSRDAIIRLVESREPSLKDKIVDYEIVLGSASVKTVVKIKLNDGRQMALLLQKTGVKDNISMNLDLGKQFIEVLRRKDIIKNSKFLQAMVEALEEQLVDEIDMKQEAEKFRKADEITKTLNEELKSELQDWKFKVPKRVEDMPLRSDMAFYEVVEGTSFEDLSPAKKLQYGSLIAKANLKSLFKFGWFDPDRHTGNILINEKTKEIIFLDYGQFASFSKQKSAFKWDPRLTLAHFVNALDKGDAFEIVHYANMMTKDNKPMAKADQARLINGLQSVISNSSKNNQDFQQRLLDVVDYLMNNEIKIGSNYLFGALKGLVILYGEKYVEFDDFKNILKAEIKNLVLQKTPVIVAEKVAVTVKKLTLKNEAVTNKKTEILRCEALF